MTSKIEQYNLAAPAALEQPVTLIEHGQARQDEYRWMHDLESPGMQKYLRSNNEHAGRVMAAARLVRPPVRGTQGVVAAG